MTPKDINVVVVPETADYKLHVSHENIVWINKKLGIPDLINNNAHYLAPFWLQAPRGVMRIYHIQPELMDTSEKDASTIKLGNSFVLDSPWTKIGQPLRFEYHSLAEFGFEEIKPGLLSKI